MLGAGPRPVTSVGRGCGGATTTLRYPCPDTSTREAVERWRDETHEIVRRRRSLLGSRWATVIRIRTALGTARALRKLRGGSRVLPATPEDVANGRAAGGSLTSSSAA